MQHKHILYGIIVLFILTSIGLSIRANQAKDPELNKNWWVLAFSQPASNSLDFIIENHSIDMQFTYEITQPHTETLQRTIDIPRGQSKEVSVASTKVDAEQTRITVWTREDDTKVISK